MFNETEPIRRPRRGSVDRASARRPSSVIDPYTQPHRSSRDLRPPPSTRGFDKINDIGRTSSVREPVRSSSRDRTGSYDVPPYDLPLTTVTITATITMPFDSHDGPQDNSPMMLWNHVALGFALAAPTSMAARILQGRKAHLHVLAESNIHHLSQWPGYTVLNLSRRCPVNQTT